MKCNCCGYDSSDVRYEICGACGEECCEGCGKYNVFLCDDCQTKVDEYDADMIANASQMKKALLEIYLLCNEITVGASDKQLAKLFEIQELAKPYFNRKFTKKQKDAIKQWQALTAKKRAIGLTVEEQEEHSKLYTYLETS